MTDESDWIKIKLWLQKQQFPEKAMSEHMVVRSGSAFVGETHSDGRERHSLQTYSFEKQLPKGFSVEWKYNFCPECRKTITKLGTVLNHEENLAYQRVFVLKGEAVDATALFGNSLLFGGG